MSSKFAELMKNYGVVVEKSNPDLMTDDYLPTPGAEVIFKANAAAHPFIKSKGSQFAEKIQSYVSEQKKKNKKYRIIISAVNPVRTGVSTDSTGATIGFTVTLIEQTGVVNKNHFEVPLEVVEIVNASWNQNGADVPDAWKYDTAKYTAFANAVKGYYVGPHAPNAPEGKAKADK
jgi:hypothetical protein